MSALITADLVSIDTSLGSDRREVIRSFADRVVAAGRATDVEALFADAWEREQETDTGVPGGIAIPHCRSAAVTEPTLAMARLDPPVDFGAKDAAADITFFIAAPEGSDKEHLQLLAQLARSLIKSEFTGQLRAATSPQAIVDLVDEALGLTAKTTADDGASGQDEAAAAAADDDSGPSTARKRTLVGVTACPTGIAHTYMAADALAEAATEAGAEMQVETQGSAGSKPLDPAVIDAADAVIFAVDVDVRDKARFAGKPVVSAAVKRGIDDPAGMVAEALEAAEHPDSASLVAAQSEADSGGGDGSGPAAGTSSASSGGEHIGQKLKKWLLTGVSYMIPFVAAGGLLMALGFLLAGYKISDNAGDILLNTSLVHPPDGGVLTYLGALSYQIGTTSMGFLVAALAGYIAFAIADRPGLAPGFTVGAIAVFMHAGFIGGLIGGLLAGGVAWAIGQIKAPRWISGLMPVVLIPFFATLISSGLMLAVLGGPIAGLMSILETWLNGMTGVSAIVLGLILGLMMCFDLGGPLNKTAYAFAVAGLANASQADQAPWMIMAAVMASGMVPPIGMALATVIGRKQFTKAEHENGKAAWLLGASFITEGAIPFAAADPFRVIPSGMVGGAVAGAITMGAGVTSKAPHGGIFVFFAIGNIAMYVVAIVVGALITALLTVGSKKWIRKRPKPNTSAAPSSETAGAPTRAGVASRAVAGRAVAGRVVTPPANADGQSA